MYAKIENNVVTVWPIMNMTTHLPGMSFPEGVPESSLPSGYVKVFSAAPPICTSQEKVVPSAPVFNGDQWVQGWTVLPKYSTQEEEELATKAAAEQEYALAKEQRDVMVANIKVTVGTKIFDGDEISQGRLARAIVALRETGVETTQWKLADNTMAVVTLAELVEALVLSGQAQTDVWMI